MSSQSHKQSESVPGSVWEVWHIRVAMPFGGLHTIGQTVKARSKDEAERKAVRLLAGRVAAFQVFLPEVEPCGALT